LPAGSVVIAGPDGAGSVGLTRVQVTVPVDVAGVGAHVVPGIVTVSPGVTPVQVTVLLALVTQVGATGGVWSTVTLVGGDAFPWGSVVVTVITVPLAGIVAGIQDHVPLAATTGFGVQTGLSEGSVIFIISPGVPVPEIGEPSVGLTTGAEGVEVRALLTVVAEGAEGVFPGVAWVALTTLPVARGATRLQVQIPEADTITGALVQVAPVTVTVDPGVPVPVTTVSVLLIGLIVGVVDWAPVTGLVTTLSVTVVEAGAETLPVGSVAVTLTTVPVARGVAKVQE
jgi:hypothetical protein